MRPSLPAFTGALLLAFAGVALSEDAEGGIVDALQNYVECAVCESRPDLSGPMEDCCCDIETLIDTNAKHILPVLDELSRTAFFRYFKVDLWRPCPFWDDSDAVCARKECAVEGQPELPPGLLADDTRAPQQVPASDSRVDLTASGLFRPDAAAQADLLPWALPLADGEAERGLWTVQDEASASTAFVDLLANPEGMTGYAGANAAQVWSNVYEANCFDDEEDGICMEERVFRRILSGMHSSISTHIALTYTDARQPSVAEWVRRVGRSPERVQNLYLTFLFVTRAVQKARPRLRAALAEASTGRPESDARARRLLERLADASVDDIANGFDETALFKVRRDELVSSCPTVLGGMEDVDELMHRYQHQAARQMALRESFQQKFRNISRIIDCIGCEKCRLWGKLQFLGLGTAMKVLFSEGDELPDLTRNEVVAFLNVFHRLSISVEAVRTMRQMEVEQGLRRAVYLAAGGVALLVVVLVGSHYRFGSLGPVQVQANLTVDPPGSLTFAVLIEESVVVNMYEPSLRIQDPDGAGVCDLPASLRIPIGTNANGTSGTFWVPGGPAQYYLMLLRCHGTGVRVSGTVSLQDTFAPSWARHADAADMLRPIIAQRAAWAFAVLLLIWLVVRWARWPDVRKVHTLIAACLAMHILASLLEARLGYQIGAEGTASAALKGATSFVRTLTDVSLLATMALVGLGWSVMRDEIGPVEQRVGFAMLGLYVVMGVLQAACEATSTTECTAFALGMVVVHSVAMFGTVVAVNYSIMLLKNSLRMSAVWLPAAGREYGLLFSFYSLRHLFVLMLLGPSVLIVLQVTMLQWPHWWMTETLQTVARFIVLAAAAAIFRPGRVADTELLATVAALPQPEATRRHGRGGRDAFSDWEAGGVATPGAVRALRRLGVQRQEEEEAAGGQELELPAWGQGH